MAASYNVPPGAALYMQQRMSGVSLLYPKDAHGNGGDGDNGLVASTAQCVWPCSRVLAAAFDSPRFIDCQGLTVLELGAGCGLPGLAAWRAGASAVWLTELPENVARLRAIVVGAASASAPAGGAATNRSAMATGNCNYIDIDHTSQRNGSPACVRVEALDWTQPLPQHIAQTHFDLVLGADLVFWPALFDALLSTLEALPGSPRIILGTANHRLGRGDDFELRAVARGWMLRELKLPTDSSPQGFDVYDFSPRLLEMMRAT